MFRLIEKEVSILLIIFLINYLLWFSYSTFVHERAGCLCESESH